MVIAGAIALGAKGVVAKFLYSKGLDFTTVVAVRAVLAVPGFLLLALFLGGLDGFAKLKQRDIVLAIFAGMLSYYVGAGINFYALTLIDASVERALLFSYPALVVVYDWLARRERPPRPVLLAVGATYVGIAFTVGLIGTDTHESNLVGGLLVMVCAATIAVYFLLSARLTRTMGSALFTFIAMAAAGTAWFIHYAFSNGWGSIAFDRETSIWMTVMVIAVTILPLYLMAEGVRRIGALRASIASTVGPVAAALLAIAFLEETLQRLQILGIGLIVLGIAVVERQRVSQASS